MRIESRLNSLGLRLKELTPERIIVLAELPDGTREEMTVDRMLETGADFCRVVSGNDLKDIDRILSTYESVID